MYGLARVFQVLFHLGILLLGLALRTLFFLLLRVVLFMGLASESRLELHSGRVFGEELLLEEGAGVAGLAGEECMEE